MQRLFIPKLRSCNSKHSIPSEHKRCFQHCQEQLVSHPERLAGNAGEQLLREVGWGKAFQGFKTKVDYAKAI